MTNPVWPNAAKDTKDAGVVRLGGGFSPIPAPSADKVRAAS